MTAMVRQFTQRDTRALFRNRNSCYIIERRTRLGYVRRCDCSSEVVRTLFVVNSLFTRCEHHIVLTNRIEELGNGDVHCTPYNSNVHLNCTVYVVQCKVVQCYSLQCTQYSVHCTCYSVQCTLYIYSIHRTQYTIRKHFYVHDVHCTYCNTVVMYVVHLSYK